MTKEAQGDGRLRGKRVAILATDGFEQSELVEPLRMLREAGAACDIVAPDGTREPGKIRGWDKTDWGDSIDVDQVVAEASADDYDALVLPGGVMNPDKLRMRGDATTFVRDFFKAGKPVSAICHAPQLLIDAGLVEGRELTSYPSLKNDLKNAGARWIDSEVVSDSGLTTSRKPDDIPAFVEATIESIARGPDEKNKTA